MISFNMIYDSLVTPGGTDPPFLATWLIDYVR